jgi:hypothetical protein
VTTIDPAPAVHSELVIAGTAQQAGLPQGVAGIAPLTCGFQFGAPAFAFANTIGNDPQAICYTAAAQLGAFAALEPLFNCPDVMSYLGGCGPKSFRNEVSQCGTFQASACFCGGSSRNSYQSMRSRFGAPDLVLRSGFE